MTISIFVIGVLSFLAGGTAAWIIFQARLGKRDDRAVEMKSRLNACETVLEETKQRLTEKEKATEGIRDRMESLQKDKAVAETRVEETNKKMEEQKELFNRSKEKMTETFQALSGESLKSNNKAFLELAKESLEVILKEAKGDIIRNEESIKHTVKPLEEALKRYEKQIGELEKTRATAYGNMEGQIRSLIDSQQSLQKETGNLVTALRRPEVRGRWGEVTLKRVAELAGMIEHCDYTEQVSVDTAAGRIRPDMIVRLPADREIVVDSKVSLDAFLDAISADTEEERKTLMIKHAQQVRKHMKDLSGKAYWDQFEKTPEFVVMFIPGESFLSVAVENDLTLIEDGMEKGVIIATPTTLISLLRAIAYGWRQEQVEKNAREISVLGRELYERIQPFLGHVNKAGSYLSQSVDAFNDMIGSLERRVIVSIKKFRELGVSGEKELPDIKQIDRNPLKTQEAEEEGSRL